MNDLRTKIVRRIRVFNVRHDESHFPFRALTGTRADVFPHAGFRITAARFVYSRHAPYRLIPHDHDTLQDFPSFPSRTVLRFDAGAFGLRSDRRRLPAW